MKNTRRFVFISLASLVLSSCSLLPNFPNGSGPLQRKSSEEMTSTRAESTRVDYSSDEIDDISSNKTSNNNQNQSSSSDEHHYSSSWSKDRQYHWHACTDRGYESLYIDKEEHSFEIYSHTEATFNSYEVTTYRCVVCGYSYQEIGNTAEHNYSDDYSFDDVYHWHQCIDPGYEDLTTDFVEHNFIEAYHASATFEKQGYTGYVCTICGYSYTVYDEEMLQHSYSNEWSVNENSHWHSCLDEGYEDLQSNSQNHLFGNYDDYLENNIRRRRCQVCNYSYLYDEDGNRYEDNILEDENGFHYYIISDSECAIGGSDLTSQIEDLVIPSSYQGRSVVRIIRWGFDNNNVLRSLVIPDSVTDIGGNAFGWCNNLLTIQLGNGIETIGNGAFYSCCGFSELTLPDSLISIGASAFTWCSALTSITFGESIKTIGDEAFGWCNQLTVITLPDSLENLGEGAFRECNNISEININNNPHFSIFDGVLYNQDQTTLILCPSRLYENDFELNFVVPDTVTTIADSAFNNCQFLKTISIPNSVNQIGKGAFRYCHNLMAVAYNGSLSEINDETFYNCDNLQSFDLPNTVTRIGYRAFSCCYNLQSFNFSGALTRIDDYAFSGCNSLTNVYLPDSITNMGYGVFNCCTSLSGVNIPASLVSIFSDTFSYCSSLTSIFIPNTLINIESGAFMHCNNLESIIVEEDSRYFKVVDGILYNQYVETLIVCPAKLYSENDEINFEVPESVYSIGNGAFTDCKFLKSISIPNRVSFISDYTFEGCTSLEAVGLSENIYSINYSAFANCSSLTSISIPDKVSYINDNVFNGCSSLASITLPDRLSYLGYNVFSNCSSLTSITIPNGVTSLYWGVFDSCTSLESVYIPDSVTYIDQYVFNGCTSLQEVRLPNGLERIGSWTFQGCSSLTSVTLPDSIISIDSYAFWGCTSLTSVILGKSVQTIGEQAFAHCYALTNIVIPKSVISIDSWAFDNCYCLQSVYYEGTLEEWEQISIGENNNYYLVNATKYFYLEEYDWSAGNYWHYVDGVPTIWNY